MGVVSVKRCACGQPATANGRECGFHFRQRLASLTLDGSVTATRTKQNYYDAESLAKTVDPDAKERMLDHTDGLGFAKLDAEGRPWHRNRKTGEVEPLTEREIDRVYLGGDQEVDV